MVPHYENTLNVLAVPYDTAAVGYQNDIVNNIRLWSAEIPEEESNYERLLFRLKQEYFMVSTDV